MFSKKNVAIFYIDKNKGTFFTNSLPSALELIFPKEVLSHLEIVNAQKLDELISKFIESKKIPPCQIFIILGENTTFEKDITDIPRIERNVEIQKFLDIVPFEEISSRVFRVGKSEKLVVANKNFLKELNRVLMEKEFTISAVIPLSLAKVIMPKLKLESNLPTMLKKIDALKQYNLLPTSAHSKSSSYLQNYRLIILVSVFAILLTILGILVYSKLILDK